MSRDVSVRGFVGESENNFRGGVVFGNRMSGSEGELRSDDLARISFAVVFLDNVDLGDIATHAAIT